MDGFDWDEGNRSKCGTHGVSAAEIEALFRGDFRVAPDRKHADGEVRLIAVGRTVEGRPMFVAFTLRASGSGWLIRPISARYMHAKEIASYEAEGA